MYLSRAAKIFHQENNDAIRKETPRQQKQQEQQPFSIVILCHYGLNCLGSVLGKGKIFSLLHSVQTSSWGPPNLLSTGSRGLLPRE
jgi:hypothetical protein